MQGYSLGGMLVYYAASQLSDVMASVAVNSASPLIGFGEVPLDSPISLIDFHGFSDRKEGLCFNCILISNVIPPLIQVENNLADRIIQLEDKN